jgi:excisionase family DNA binding protein
MNTTETARYLNLSKRKVEQLKSSRQLPFIRIGGAIRFYPPDVEEFIRKHRVGRN